MQPVWAVALEAMQQDAARVDRVASNLANVTTVGYKREVMVQRPYSAETSFGQTLSALQAQDGVRDGVRAEPALLGVHRDQRPGTLKSTGNPFDLALTGPGLLEVSTTNGPAYSRQGQLSLDSQGRLVLAATGDPVMGLGGDIVMGHGPFTIDTSGRVTQGGRVVGQVKVVSLQTADNNRPLGNGLVAATGHVSALADAEVHLRQGYVENANVNAAHEMVQLTQTMRHFESMQRAAQSYDDMLATAVRKLGDL
jgi:flagellar basal-body rod protein FlgG